MTQRNFCRDCGHWEHDPGSCDGLGHYFTEDGIPVVTVCRCEVYDDQASEMTENERLRNALDYAKQIIRSYEMDCRNLPHYLADGNSAVGFCQGTIYRDAISVIEAML